MKVVAQMNISLKKDSFVLFFSLLLLSELLSSKDRPVKESPIDYCCCFCCYYYYYYYCCYYYYRQLISNPSED